MTNPSPALLSALLDTLASTQESHANKWQAVHQISSFGKQATPGLLGLLQQDGPENQKYYAIRALGYLRDPAATETLCTLLTNVEFGPRRYAAIALGQVRDPQAVDALARALDDVEFVRVDALNALVRINSPEAIRVLERHHCGRSDVRLRLDITCDGEVYSLGDSLVIAAHLTNVSPSPVWFAFPAAGPRGYPVFQRPSGEFIEEVDTGLREGRLTKPASLTELKPGNDLRWELRGSVENWTRGEKDDQTFVPSPEPFLTINFQQKTYHVRRPGVFQVRLVLRQGRETLDYLRAAGVDEAKLKTVWQGVVCSAPFTFTVKGP